MSCATRATVSSNQWYFEMLSDCTVFYQYDGDILSFHRICTSSRTRNTMTTMITAVISSSVSTHNVFSKCNMFFKPDLNLICNSGEFKGFCVQIFMTHFIINVNIVNSICFQVMGDVLSKLYTPDTWISSKCQTYQKTRQKIEQAVIPHLSHFA